MFYFYLTSLKRVNFSVTFNENTETMKFLRTNKNRRKAILTGVPRAIFLVGGVAYTFRPPHNLVADHCVT